MDSDSGLPQEVITAVTDARYRREVADHPEAARRRAQAGWVIVSAIAAALIAGGALTNLGRQPIEVRALGIAAVALWIVAAGLFFRAAALGYAPTDPEYIEGENATDRFVQHVLDTAKEEYRTIDKRINLAGVVALAPLALTLATLGVAVLHEPARETKRAAVALDAGSRAALRELCERRIGSVVRGRIDVAGRGDGTLELLLPAGRCRREEAVEVALPEAKLLVLVSR